MRTNIKTWLETTGYSVAKIKYTKPPALPYIVFTEAEDVGGADNKNCIANRQISIELYADKINATAEAAIETLLDNKAVKYKKDCIWIDSEKYFETIYDFNLIEKI